jgi:hypothetical protein
VCTEKGTYCAERPLRDEPAGTNKEPTIDAGSSIMVPVCARADECSLSQPYPCPAGKDCQCPEGTACSVVDAATPTTTCLKPGNGSAGQACPCAFGHVCSQTTQKCLKLCQTKTTDAECSKCQASVELPDGWGVCVGTPVPDAG